MKKKISKRELVLNIAKVVLLALIVIIIPLCIWLTNKELFMQFDSVDAVAEYIRGYKGKSVLIYLGLQMLQVIIAFLPGEIFNMASGYVFGVTKGLCFSFLGCLLGTMVSFTLARLLGRDFIRIFISEEKLVKYSDYLNSDRARLICFIIYLLPGIPKDVVSYIGGVTEMKMLSFMVLSMIGRIPGMTGCVLIGASLDNDNYKIAIIIAIAAVIIIGLAFIFKNKINEFIENRKTRN